MSGENLPAAEKTAASLRKTWLLISVLVVLLALNVYDVTQGWGITGIGIKAVLSIDFADGIPEAVGAMFGVGGLSVLTGLTGLLLLLHARSATGTWVDRYPFRLFDLPTDRAAAKAVQVVALITLTLAPLYTLGHSWSVFHDYGVQCVETGQDPQKQWLEAGRDVFAAIPTDGKQRLGSSEEPNGTPNCAPARTVDFAFPWESYAFAAMTLVAFAVTGWGLWAVLVSPKMKQAADGPPEDDDG
jgi:hypothetical protein